MRVLAVVPLQILFFTFYTPSSARLTRARTEYSILSYAIQAPTSEKKRKKGNPRPRIKKTLLRSKNPLVLDFRALPAARRDFASQKSDVRLLTWLHAAAFGVAVGAPPLPRPVVAQQLRASVPPPRPLSRAAVVRFCCFSAAGGRGSGAGSYALCADGFASASVALSGLCALPFRFSALVAWGSRQT